MDTIDATVYVSNLGDLRIEIERIRIQHEQSVKFIDRAKENMLQAQERFHSLPLFEFYPRKKLVCLDREI